MNYPARAWPKCARCFKPGHPDRRVVHEGETYCSPSCVEALQESVSQAVLRAQVLARDGGVCASCSLPVLGLEEELAELRRASVTGNFAARNRWEARVAQLAKLGFDQDAVENGKTLWQADHVEPRVKGGPTTLANARTLCLQCHRAVTDELARDRAALRRPFRRSR